MDDLNGSADTSWAASRRKFIEAGGQTTQSLGLGRIIGQIYALLYITPHPLCLGDIASELAVSKASVSTTVRQLQGWSAVRQVWVKGDRKDYYEAETDFNAIIKRGLLDLVRKKLTTAGAKIGEVEAALSEHHDENGTNGQHPGGSDETNGTLSREEMDVILDRFRRAKELHQKLDGLIQSPLIDHLL